MRRVNKGLARYVVTPQTAKHRFFTTLDTQVLPDDKLIAIALDDPFYLGVLSSRVHIAWAFQAGSRLGVGNDSVYNKTSCFDAFPFPGALESHKSRIREIADSLGAHRARQQREHSDLTLTGMYNVLEKLRAGEPLTAKERTIHEQGVVSVLRDLHDDLDRAVFDAYGWGDLAERLVGRPGATTPLPDKPADQAEAEEALLSRLVDLNARRTAEEAQGHVRWLRSDFQAPEAVQGEMPTGEAPGTPAVATPAAAAGKRVFPTSMVERVQAVRDDLAEGPSTVEALAERYKRKPRQRIEETLQAVAIAGMAYKEGEVWRLR